ncbi:MAG: tetratricopeptide repeat protein [Acidobacteriaceae bacterium]|nr:tetratricopeptide repeat protein [Acidobacteriaceae bacterium]
MSPLQLFEIGWLYGRARHFNEALSVFQSVPDGVPDRPSHQYAVALSEFELANYKGAIKVLKTLETEGNLSPESANLLAVSYSKLALYEQAQSILLQEIQRHREDQSAYLNLVTLYADQDRYAEAAVVASDAVQAFPESAEVRVVRGAANTLIGQLDEAYDDFSNAIRLAPDWADPRFFLALTRYKQGKFTDAIHSLESANRRGIVDSDLHYLLAECLLKLNAANTQAALRELHKAIELNSNSASARALRGKLLFEAGSTKEAVADLERAHQRDPGSRTAAYNLARAYQKLGRKEDSQLLFQQLRSGKIDAVGELSQRRLNEALIQKEAQP